MDGAVAGFRALGFHVTERGYHTLGSINHLIVFERDYLELLGFGSGPVRPELAGFPVGLNGLVFATEDADALYRRLSENGVPLGAPTAFSRPVELGEVRAEARFRTTRLPADAASHGRVYFCEHLTPELVWRQEWRDHANGAVGIARIVLAVSDPVRASALFARMFGPDAVRPGARGGRSLDAAGVTIDFLDHETLRRDYGEALPDPSGRSDYMAVLGLRTRSLATTERFMRSAAAPVMRPEPDRLIVPAHAAVNTTLEFVE